MFQNATVRLTILYTAIIVVICIIFSAIVYSVSVNELRSGLFAQQGFIERLPRFRGDILNDPTIMAQRDQFLQAGRSRIIWGLIRTDLLVIVLGGIGSFFLARRTLKPIQEAHDAQVRFTADASHELRTPLMAMQAETEVALRDPKLTKEQAKSQLKSNLEEIDKMASLTGALLQLARNGEQLNPTRVSLEDVVVTAVAGVSSLAKNKKIAIRNKVQTVEVKGDRSGLIQLLTILLDNAIKYTPNEKTVTLSSSRSDGHVMVSVTDQGRGIKSSDLPHLFERFYRADASRSKANVEGYGLGLAIAQKIVEAHQGSFEVKSTPGQGSTFTIKLPVLYS
jgi:signal transduction histidine kinase